MKKQKTIENKIIDELIDLDCPLSGKHINYWTILLVAEFYNKFKTDKMIERYKYIAEKVNSKPGAVERVLNRGKQLMSARIKEKYNVRTKIMIESVITLFNFKIFREIK